MDVNLKRLFIKDCGQGALDSYPNGMLRFGRLVRDNFQLIRPLFKGYRSIGAHTHVYTWNRFGKLTYLGTKSDVEEVTKYKGKRYWWLKSFKDIKLFSDKD